MALHRRTRRAQRRNRLEQHPTGERQLPYHAGTGQQRQNRAQFLVGKPFEFAGQSQLQRVSQFVEAHQHPAFVLEADDLLLESLEENLRGAAGNLIQVDAGEDVWSRSRAAFGRVFESGFGSAGASPSNEKQMESQDSSSARPLRFLRCLL